MSRFSVDRWLPRRAALTGAMVFAFVPGWAEAQSGGSAVAHSSGAIVGTVRDSAGRALPGARITAGAALRTMTDSTGAFALLGVPRGPALVTVRRLGFQAETSRVDVADAPVSLKVRLTPVPATLAAVRVRARRVPYEARLAGFNERRARHIGYFITREQIESRNDTRLTEALRRIPGVQPYTMPGALGRTVRLAGSHCAPVVFVDGFAANLGSFDLDMIDLGTVEGVEVYPNGASIPAVFLGTYGAEECGVIAVWSAPARPRLRANQLSPEPVDVKALVQSGAVHRPEAVDVQARYVAGSARPIYPDSLLRAHVAGRAVAQFVVDTAGDVEEGTIRIVSSSADAFGSAVRDALPTARFEPAQLGGHKVRALVTLPFDFDPSEPDRDPTPPGR